MAAVHGTPTQAGTYAFTITATDHNSLTATQSYTMVVAGGSSGAGIAHGKHLGASKSGILSGGKL